MKKKKILIHSIVFSPDGVSTAYLYNDIALKFKESGYKVAVLTTTPHYNIPDKALTKQLLRKKLFGLYYESSFHGIRVKHVPQKKYKQSILRIIGFVYWHFLSFFIGLFEKNIDVILSPSPPLTIGFVNLILGKLKGAKVMYNVQEIYPDFLIEQGGLKSKPIISVLKWLERLVYNKSDATTTIDQVFYNTIIDRFENKTKLHIIPNFVDTDLYKPLSKEKLELNRDLFPINSNLKVMYAGNIGHAQDWSPLIKAAIELREEPIEFFIIGEGVLKDYVKDEIEKNKLNKVHLLSYQPRELMPFLIAYSDLQFIFMSKEMEGHGFPSKVYTIMACARPLIVCSGENTPIHNFLKETDCSFLIADHNESIKVQMIVNILKAAKSEDLELKGKAGLQIIEQYYSKDVVSTRYVQLTETLF